MKKKKVSLPRKHKPGPKQKGQSSPFNSLVQVLLKSNGHCLSTFNVICFNKWWSKAWWALWRQLSRMGSRWWYARMESKSLTGRVSVQKNLLIRVNRLNFYFLSYNFYFLPIFLFFLFWNWGGRAWPRWSPLPLPLPLPLNSFLGCSIYYLTLLLLNITQFSHAFTLLNIVYLIRLI